MLYISFSFKLSATDSTADDAEAEKSQKLKIIIIVVVVAVCLVLIIIVIACCVQRRRQQSTPHHVTKEKKNGKKLTKQDIHQSFRRVNNTNSMLFYCITQNNSDRKSYKVPKESYKILNPNRVYKKLTRS